MKANHNKLPEVNQFIKENKLTPCETEYMCGSLYDDFYDTTYLVVYENNTYISYDIYEIAQRDASYLNGVLVICRGEIHE